MTIPPTNSLATSAVCTPSDTLSADSATEVKKVSVTQESDISSSCKITAACPPEGSGSLRPLLEGRVVAPINSEVVLHEERLPLEIPIEKAQSIFNCVFCCCRK